MIRIDGLHKRFVQGRGRKSRVIEAVRGVTFQADDGRITALLGPNGAGKTTTLRMVAALLAPDSGHIEVDGIDVARQPRKALARLGVLSDARGLYPRLTARENIVYHARLQGMLSDAADARAQALAELLEFKALLDRRTDGFSSGERMKVALARALIHDPRHLILDEPTNGLDVTSTRALRRLLRHLRDQGKCLLFSTHIMQEVELLCDEIVIVAHGRTIAHGTAAALCADTGAENLEDAFVRLALEAGERGVQREQA